MNASRRDGWPPNAVEVAELLLRFSVDHLAPRLVPSWDRIVGFEDPVDRLAAMRSEQDAWWDAHDPDVQDDEAEIAWMTLRCLINATNSVGKARRLADGPEAEWGSANPLALARSTGRRCGELLTLLHPDAGGELLQHLP